MNEWMNEWESPGQSLVNEGEHLEWRCVDMRETKLNKILIFTNLIYAKKLDQVYPNVGPQSADFG